MLFRALPVRDARERGVGERVLRRDRRPGAGPPTRRRPRRARRARPTAATSCDAWRERAALASRSRPAAPRRSRRSRSGRHRCLAGAASDPSRDSGAAAVESDAGVAAGSADQSGSRSRIFAIESETVSPANVDAPGQHLVEHAAERPDVGALVDRQSARLLGTHVGGRADDGALRASPAAPPAHASGRATTPSPPTALARPKSSTFTTPSGVILMFAGFRSRWTIPLSWATSSASAICRAMASASTERQPRARRRANPTRRASVSRERLALDELENQEADAVRFLEAVDRADVGMVQRREHPRLALEAREPIRVARERARAGS